MKNNLFLLVFWISFCGLAFAQVVIDTATIAVDRNAGTYTFVGKPPSSVTFYILGENERCYITAKNAVGVNLLGTFVGANGGPRVYCYSIP